MTEAAADGRTARPAADHHPVLRPGVALSADRRADRLFLQCLGPGRRLGRALRHLVRQDAAGRAPPRPGHAAGDPVTCMARQRPGGRP